LIWAQLIGAQLIWPEPAGRGRRRVRAVVDADHRSVGAAAILRRNLLIYGLGGIVAPFVGIKLIDLFVTAVGLA